MGNVKRVDKFNWTYEGAILPSGTCYVAVVERRREGGWIVNYLDDAGTLLWSATVCCSDPPGTSSGSESIVWPSKDGKVIAVLDANGGESCYLGLEEGSARVPKTCTGLRVFTYDGRILFSANRFGREPLLSPSGNFLAYEEADGGWRLLQIFEGRSEDIETPPRGMGSPIAVLDDGTVKFSWKPGRPGYRYLKGHGLKQVRDR